MLKLALVAVTAVCLLGCQQEFSDEDAARFVDALLSDERYLTIMESPERLERSIDLMMQHPTMQTTPREDCIGMLLMTAPTEGLLSDPMVDEYCEWYEWQLIRLETGLTSTGK